jgi:hypothetical protein
MDQAIIKNGLVQFIQTLWAHKAAATFLKKHRLWEGFWKYGWVSKVLIGLAILFGIKFLNIMLEWIYQLWNADAPNAIAKMGLFAQDMITESYQFLFTGSIKYVMLLLLEVIIFHICRRTLDILGGPSADLTFASFIKAQIRMLKVVVLSYALEMIFTVLIKIGFGIFGTIDFLEPFFIFIVQCYFLGFVVMDNYNEQFHLGIKDSLQYGKQFMGVSLAVGLVLSIVLMIPVFGAIIGPVIAAITVTMVMYRISDLHLRPEKPQEA